MLNLYATTEHNGLTSCPLDKADKTHIVWLDLLEPSREEELAVESLLGISIPTRDEMHEIEISSRLYQDGEAVYCTATILTQADTDQPEAHAVSFVFVRHMLVTVRYATPRPFILALNRLTKQDIHGTETQGKLQGYGVFSHLADAVVDRLADLLEDAGHKLDDMSRNIFRPTLKGKQLRDAAKPDLDEMLRQIGVIADLISKTRESLGSVARMLGYIAQHGHTGKREAERLSELQRDIPALNDHASFLANKVSFLLDATLGMISIEQSAIIKIFSVAAVVFLPPTLVASIYGMNFEHMPELSLLWGYPVALCLMALSAWLPYQFFKRKKWL